MFGMNVRAALGLCLLLGCSGKIGGGSGGGEATGGGSAGGSATGGGTAAGGGSGGGATGGGGSATGGGGGDAGSGDTYYPWEGGPAYWSQWAHGPSSDPDSFPIAVWLQSPSNARAYQAIGVNLFIGLYQGPTEDDLARLTDAGMPAFCGQDVAWAQHLADPIIEAWTQDDEPDNAQPDGMGGYGPCISPAVIQQRYATFKAADATRPVYLNVGQGAAWTDYYGRGSACAGRSQDYAEYAKGADVMSFDIYPVNSTDAPVQNNLWYVALGVDHLRDAVDAGKPVFAWIESTGIDGPSGAPTPEQTRSEVWMALIHGARGYGYFCHVFSPSFIEAGLLADPAMKAGVAALNQQVLSLAPVLNTPSISNAVTVASSDAGVPVDLMVKRSGGSLYLFAESMRTGGTTATFTVQRAPGTHVEVLGESRSLSLSGGQFSDDFGDYQVHLYRLGP